MKHVLDTFGPVFLYWVTQMRTQIRFLQSANSAKPLFCARAGKRIQDLLSIVDPDLAAEGELFGISRIAACKVALGQEASYHSAFPVIEESLGHDSLGKTIEAFLVHDRAKSDDLSKAMARLKNRYNVDDFRSLLAANDPHVLYLKSYFANSRNGLNEWLNAREADHFILIDSGWKASIQKVLTEVFPDFKFHGLYFGVMDHDAMPQRHGIVFDAPAYTPQQPSSALAIHRHLVETMLEVNAPSVEELVGGPLSNVAQEQVAAVANEQIDQDIDAFFVGIKDYIADNCHKDFHSILEEFYGSLASVKRMLVHPTAEEALFLSGKRRSIDFGREGSVPVLRKSENDCNRSVDFRLKAALWPQGQMALEFDGDEARKRQAEVTGTSKDPSYFHSHLRPENIEKKLNVSSSFDFEGSVAIVTRTKNRPILFIRAARSVANQTWKNIQWVIVNDGGDTEEVRQIIMHSGVDPRRVTLIENPQSVGMEAASNLGVQSVNTEYVVIHDDDDAWEPRFLEESISFLKGKKAITANEKGVISRAWRVSEEIRGDDVIYHSKTRFMPWVNEITISQMAVGNFFAPISFVYERSIYNEIGGYDESLPVLGDWKFNLEFLARANIALIDQYLSHYYHRDIISENQKNTYSNSVIGGQSLHQQYSSVVINALLRDESVPLGLKLAVNNAHLQRVSEYRFNQLDNFRDHAIDRINHIHSKLDHMAHEINTVSHSSIFRSEKANQSLADFSSPESNAALKNVKSHLRRSFTNAIFAPSTSLIDKIKLIRAVGLINQLEKRSIRERIVERYNVFIPSPAEFDHVTYLRQHPEIWATEFNGPGELLPYHHYLIHAL